MADSDPASSRLARGGAGSPPDTRAGGLEDLVPVLVPGAAFFMIVLDTSIVNLALPRIRDAFGAGLTTLQWLVDGYALVFASLMLTAGALGDRYGARRVFVAGLVVFFCASAACGLAGSVWACNAPGSCRASGPPCCSRTPWRP